MKPHQPVVSVSDDVLHAWQSLVDTMARAFDVPAGLIMRLSGDEIEVLVASDTEGNPYSPGDSEHFFDSGLYCETVINTRATLEVPNALADPEWRDNPDVKLNMIAYLGMPIFLPDGTPFGTICVLDSQERRFSDLYIDLLKQFKSVAESHLGLAVVNEQLAERNREFQRALAEVHELREIIPICMSCKKVREDDGYWTRLESYLARYQDLAISHAFCPECADKWEAEMDEELAPGTTG